MQRNIALLLVVLLLFGCNNSKPNKTFAETNFLVDSLIVEKILDGRELYTSTWLNDSTLIAWGEGEQVLSIFAKKEKVLKRIYEKIISHSHEFRCFFLDSNKIINLIDDTNIWYSYDTSKGLKRKCKINLKLNYLKENYFIYSLHNCPAFLYRNNLFLNFAHNSTDYYFEGLKESSIAQITLKNDSFSKIKYLFGKPQNLIEQFQPFPIYCFDNKRIVLIYPGIDSLYIYNIESKEYKSIEIGNKEYRKPNPIDKNEVFHSDYNIIYRLHNFQYHSIYYNPYTKHYVLFYQLPVNSNIKVPTYDDQEISAIILDSNFKCLKYLKFKNKYRHSTYFLMTQQGLAMPLFNETYKTEGNIKHYIFNF